MDEATWLAAELGADPAACSAAIKRKQLQAAERGRPWRNARTMVRSAIPLDEWRRELAPAKRPSAQPTKTLAQCDGTDCPGARHEWTDRHGRNAFVCVGA